MPETSYGNTQGVLTYLTGLALALALTAIPFSLVYFNLLDGIAALQVIAVAALLQIIVHFRCFLHIDLTRTPRDNLVALCFAVVLIVIMIGGSLWIMFDLHHRMLVPPA